MIRNFSFLHAIFMATSEADLSSDNMDGEDEFQYRPLSTAAIFSVLFGVVSSMTFLAANVSLLNCLIFCPIPVVGLICGLVALKKIRQMPDQFSGFNLAVAGTVMSALGLFGGLGYAGYVHATEVPPGFERLSFFDLRPDEVELRGNEAVPRDVLPLDDKRVFIKGYIRPGTHVSKGGRPVRKNFSTFMLVRDSAECCFGDISSVKYYDKMMVQINPGVQAEYSGGMFRVAGKLTIVPADPGHGVLLPGYVLEAEMVK